MMSATPHEHSLSDVGIRVPQTGEPLGIRLAHAKCCHYLKKSRCYNTWYLAYTYIHFLHIPAKSPDVSPIDHCAFGLLKRAFSKPRPTTIVGLWKDVEEEWKSIPLEILRKAFLSWKSRCRLVVQKQDCLTEHFKKSFLQLKH